MKTDRYAEERQFANPEQALRYVYTFEARCALERMDEVMASYRQVADAASVTAAETIIRSFRQRELGLVSQGTLSLSELERLLEDVLRHAAALVHAVKEWREGYI